MRAERLVPISRARRSRAVVLLDHRGESQPTGGSHAHAHAHLTLTRTQASTSRLAARDAAIRSGGERTYRSAFSSSSPAESTQPTPLRGNGPVGQIPHYRARGRSNSKDSEVAPNSESPHGGVGGGVGIGSGGETDSTDANLLDQANQFMGSMLGRIGFAASPPSNASQPSSDGGAPLSGPNSRLRIREPPSEDALQAAQQWSGVAFSPRHAASASSSGARPPSSNTSRVGWTADLREGR